MAVQSMDLKQGHWPVLYSFRRCPYAMRARMALFHAGIQCEIREVLLSHKPSTLLAISAKATVPVLQLPDGKVIDESLDIMRWAQIDHGLCWQADAAVADLIGVNDTLFKQHLDAYKYGQGVDVQSSFEAGCVFLAQLERRLTVSQYLFSDAVSLADVALFPFVRQFAAVDLMAFSSLPFIHVQQWLQGWLDDADFKAIMCKRQPWQAGDQAVFLLAE